jgi:hypothetical protein
MAIMAVIAAKRFWQMSPDFKAFFFEQINSARRRRVSRQEILFF